jgi:neutral ceramidase
MRRRTFLSVAAATPLLGQTRWQNSSTVKAGFAEADITPAIGMEQPGGYGKSFHRSLHDACKARVAVFDDGRKRAAIVGLDALIVPRGLVLDVRKAIAAKCGIPGDSVLINASHSHSSGPIGMVQPGEFDNAPELVKKLAYEQSSCADPKYLKSVHEAIVKAVCDADSAKTDLVCGVGSGREDVAAFNRRIRMTNGRTFTHPGQLNPDMIKYAGPIDPEVGVVGAWDRKGQLIGCIVNYSCHATTSPGGISANWIYYLEKAIRGFFGDKVIVVFVQGASGDITQVDNFSETQQPAAEEWAQLVGGRVGAEAMRVLLSMPRGALTPVDSSVRVLKIPRRKPAPEKVRLAMAMVQKTAKEVGVTEWTFAKETVMLDYLIQREPSADVEVQAIAIGPAVFVSNPAEYFVEFGLEIKQKSRFRYTFPAELSNGCVGYVPTEEALSESGGGYETRLTFYSNLVPTAGRQIAAAGIELANKMTPGPMPAAPKAKPASGPWLYGSVPAELH